jgi:hypothetical protein
MEWLGDQACLPTAQNPNEDLSLRLLEALLEHKPEASQVCLVDFANVETAWEQLDLVRRWSPKVKAVRADPSLRLWEKGSLIYRRALSWQLRAKKQMAEPFLSDWQNGFLTVVGGWSSDVGMNKAWPALLDSPLFPETRIIESDVSFLKKNKDDWILKAALSHSGHAIIRGIELAQERWISSVDNVCSESLRGRRWVAQRRVPIPEVEGKPCEFGLFFLNGRPSGYMCRWGHSSAITESSNEVFRPVRLDP